jgi:hypothetical protein
MVTKCPRCNNTGECKILYYYSPDTNIDNIGHYHLECLHCGKQFNHWDCDVNTLKKAYGDIYKEYI